MPICFGVEMAVLSNKDGTNYQIALQDANIRKTNIDVVAVRYFKLKHNRHIFHALLQPVQPLHCLYAGSCIAGLSLMRTRSGKWRNNGRFNWRNCSWHYHRG